VGLKYAKNALVVWGPWNMDPTVGAHDTPSDPLVGWGGDTPSPIPSAPRFSRLRHSASVAPNVKSWLRQNPRKTFWVPGKSWNYL